MTLILCVTAGLLLWSVTEVYARTMHPGTGSVGLDPAEWFGEKLERDTNKSSLNDLEARDVLNDPEEWIEDEDEEASEDE